MKNQGNACIAHLENLAAGRGIVVRFAQEANIPRCLDKKSARRVELTLLTGARVLPPVSFVTVIAQQASAAQVVMQVLSTGVFRAQLDITAITVKIFAVSARRESFYNLRANQPASLALAEGIPTLEGLDSALNAKLISILE